MFFPGCQLAASEPEQIEAAYGWLREALQEDVALFLGCCGAPANWAGRDDLLQETLDFIHKTWVEEGEPTLILACSSCKDLFEQQLPQIPLISLWQVLAEHELPATAAAGNGATLAIHDACSSRFDAPLQESVRTIINKLGYTVEELRYNRENTKCCGFGGLVFYANREQQIELAKDRASGSSLDLVVYCAMCKDLFTGEGKRSFHLLELLFAKDPEDYALRSAPLLSERHANRILLKRRLLREVWGEDVADPAPRLPGYTVVLSPEILALMEERLILDSDITDALARALADPGERFYNTEEDCYLISVRKQYVTYWVRYRQVEKTMEVVSVYSHRMDIMG